MLPARRRPEQLPGTAAAEDARRHAKSSPPPPPPPPGRQQDPGRAKGKGRERDRDSYSDTDDESPPLHGGPPGAAPLTEWPPDGVSLDDELTLGRAMEMIATGVPAHRGHRRSIPHASDRYYLVYATSAGNRGNETDRADLHDAMLGLMTMRWTKSASERADAGANGGDPDAQNGNGGGSASNGRAAPAAHPWETLEQPSYAFHYGRLPGTITFTAWASQASSPPPPIALRDPGVAPREPDLGRLLERLRQLERGLAALTADGAWDDGEDALYRDLYKRLLRDPDQHRLLGPRKALDRQITDLIVVLSRPDWIDFTNPKNHPVTRFIFDKGSANRASYTRFFQQLVLSVELDLRINSSRHSDWAKEKLMPQIPPTIQWDLALARRWRENVRVEAYGRTPDQSESPCFTVRLQCWVHCRILSLDSCHPTWFRLG